MLGELALLVRLQEVDNELMEIEEEKGDLPEQLQKLRTEIVQYKSMIDEKEQEGEEIKIKKKEQSKVVNSARDQLKKSQSVIFNVKTTKEYDAISSEIEHSKQKIAEGERIQLELMAEEEELEIELDELRSKLSSRESEFDDRQSEMNERLNSTQEEELELRHERDKLVRGINRPVLSHYDRIKQIRDGIGITQMIDAACGYCFSKIPPQRQVEIKRMDDVILCEVCGCILVDEQH